MRPGIPTTALLAALALAPPAHAFLVAPVYDDPDAWSPAEQALVTRAISDWSVVTANTAPAQHMNVNFIHVNAPGAAYLGQWQFGGVIPTAFPYSPGLVHTVYVNTAYADLMSFAADAPAADRYDFLTIIRHELGHALGFTDRLYLDNGVDRWASHISGSTFDPGGLDVPLRADGTHVDLPGDLMYYQLSKGVRKDISSTDIAMLSLAYGYVTVPEPASVAMLGVAAVILLQRRRRVG
jgi:hypothetical protein